MQPQVWAFDYIFGGFRARPETFGDVVFSDTRLAAISKPSSSMVEECPFPAMEHSS
jgi:hypothetical protein